MSNRALTDYILAVVTCRPETVAGSGAPIFIVPDERELRRVALYISKITNAMVHDLENGTFIIVKH